MRIEYVEFTHEQEVGDDLAVCVLNLLPEVTNLQSLVEI